MFQRTCLLFLLVTCFAGQAMAQNRFETTYALGPTLKIVQSRLSFNSAVVNVPDSEPEVGYQLGTFFRARVNNLYVQPELLFSRTQNALIFNDHDGIMGFNPRAEFEFTSIEIPIAIGYFYENLRFETGPAVSVLLEAEEFFLNVREKVTDHYNKVSLQYRFGVGADFNNVFFNLSYEIGLSKTGESLRQIVGRNFQPKRSQWAFSISLALHRYKMRQ